MLWVMIILQILKFSNALPEICLTLVVPYLFPNSDSLRQKWLSPQNFQHIQTCLAIITLSLPYLHQKNKRHAMLLPLPQFFVQQDLRTNRNPAATRGSKMPSTPLDLHVLENAVVQTSCKAPWPPSVPGETHHGTGKTSNLPLLQLKKKNKKAPASIIIVSKQISCYIFFLIRICL